MKKYILALLILLCLSGAVSAQSPNFPTSLDTAASLLEGTNKAYTRLSSTHAAGATTLNVTSTALFASTGILTINGSENVRYTGKNATQFTGVTRAYEGTTAVQHASGASVEHRITFAYHSVLSLATRAIEAKIGYGADTPANNEFFIGTGTGTSGWRALTSGDVTTALGYTPPNDALIVHLAGAETITGVKTHTANIIGPFLAKGNGTFDVKAYGAAGDGVADDTAEIQAAIDAAGAAGGGVVFFPRGTYRITSQLTAGLGNSTTISSYGGVSLIGQGSVKTTGVTVAEAVTLVWDGTTSTSNIMVKMAGPMSGFRMEGFHLNAASKAGIGVQVVHGQSAVIENISVFEYTAVGVDITSWNTGTFPGGGGSTDLYGDNGSLTNFILRTSSNNTIGIRLGSTGTTANWLIERGQVRQDSTTGSAGVELSHSDHCVFTDVVTAAEVGIRVKPIAIAASFPMNTSFYAGAYTGKSGSTTANGAISAGAASIVLADGTNFPTAGTAQLDNGRESITWTGKSGTHTLTGVSRGKYDTRDVAHATGVTVVVAMSVVIDESLATWSPPATYNGLYFLPFNTADGSIFPTSTLIRGVTDVGKSYGLNSLHIGAPPSRSLTASANYDILHLQAPDGKIGLAVIDTYAAGVGVTGGITFRSAGGTSAAPTATAANASTGSFGGRGFDGTDFAASNQAAIQFRAAEATSASAKGMYITFETTAKLTTSRFEAARFEAGGWLVSKELTTNPTTAELADGDQLAYYRKADKIVFAVNIGGTIHYLTTPVTTSGTATWTWSTTSP